MARYWYHPELGIIGRKVADPGFMDVCRQQHWPLIWSAPTQSQDHRQVAIEYDILDFGARSNHPGLTPDLYREGHAIAFNALHPSKRCRTCMVIGGGTRRMSAFVPKSAAMDLMGVFGSLAERNRNPRKGKDNETMDREFVKLYKDGNVMGVETNAATSEDFMRLFSEAMASIVETGRWNGDWNYQFDQWLPQAFNINAKLNGYKSDVQEIRVIRAGYSSFDAEEQVYATPQGPSPAIVRAIDEREVADAA